MAQRSVAAAAGAVTGYAIVHWWKSAEPRPVTVHERRRRRNSIVALERQHTNTAIAAASPSPPLPQSPPPRWPAYRSLLRDAFEWASATVPFFECADADVTTAYYYRWRVFWMHLRRTPRFGFVLTEFLRDVPWAGPHGTINCAYGHHAADGRWLRDEAIMDNYSSFWFSHPRADLRYTWWPAHAALERHRLDGRLQVLRDLYPRLRHEYWRWVERTRTAGGGGGGECLWQAAHDDGEENSIGLDGCRPTINAAWHGEAAALSTIASLLGNTDDAATFRREAERWRAAVRSLWNPAIGFYATRTLPPPTGRLDDVRKRRTKVGCQHCTGHGRGRDACPPEWPTNELVDVRELASLSWPWFHRAAAPEHAAAWKQLTDPRGFASRWGVRTAERRHRCYNFSTYCQTSWHGAVWPFESSKVATALTNALHDEAHSAALRDLAGVGEADFYRLLQTYARMHTRGTAREVPAGEPFVAEVFHPDDGYWIAREIMFQRNAGDRRRGDHYLHSAFAEHVLGGLVGLHVDESSLGAAKLVVAPLFAPEQLSWFAASALRVRSRDVAVVWDRDGSHFAGLAGLAVWLDGKLVCHASRTLRRCVARL